MPQITTENRKFKFDQSKKRQKRSKIRKSLHIPVTCKYNNEIYRAYIKDISLEGLFIVTHKKYPRNTNINLIFSLPTLNTTAHISGTIIRNELFNYKKNVCTPTGMAIKFNSLSEKNKNGIQKFINDPKLQPLPEVKIHYEPRFCHLCSVDLCIGCENGCLYCHFSENNILTYKKDYKTFPTPVDISSIYTIPDFSSPIFLSPSSDPFSEQSKELTHELLEFLLPKGIVFIILTKCIIQQKTLKLIEKYKNQFEGIGIGLTNLNDERNKRIEPQCPSAKERLQTLKDLKETGVKNIRLRMDPLFPIIDDTDENLEAIVKTAKEIGVNGITATYLFTFGKHFKTLSKKPFLEESMKHLTEKSPMQGGLAFTLPLKQKLDVYNKLLAFCDLYGITFNTCGCKESRFPEVKFSTTCRNTNFCH